MDIPYRDQTTPFTFDLHVRGEIPAALGGSLIIPTARRHKDRTVFSRWHDSQTDLLRLDLFPGKPGRVQTHVLAVDPDCVDLGDVRRSAFEEEAYRQKSAVYGYITQPNHGVNIAGGTVWATNLLFGAPLEVELATWRPRRVLRYVELSETAPRVSGTSHFAWSLDHRYAYFHQSLLRCEDNGRHVEATDLCLIELDVHTGSERMWQILPPPEDSAAETANFHSGFYYEEMGKRYIGLLRTGALLETLAPHTAPLSHAVTPMPASTIWVIELDDDSSVLQAHLLPGIRELDGLALSHLDVDASSGDGFVLYANYKEADIAEETHGTNVYGEPPEKVAEHYPGMIVEALNYGLVIRYEQRRGESSLRTFSRPYDPGKTSLGHTWLPINIELDDTKRRLFCTFNGFRPRLLPRHIAAAYRQRVVDWETIRYVPPLLMRFNAETLEPEYDHKGRGHLSYSEPVALAVVDEYVCTFAPEIGLRIYLADDLNHMLCHAESSQLMHWQDSHFRTEPAHMQFVHR